MSKDCIKINDLELVAGECCDCIFRVIGRDCRNVIRDNFNIDVIDLNEELGDCVDNEGCRYYKLKED